MARLWETLARPVPAAVVLVAGVLRFLGLGSESLWIDEAASLAIVRGKGLTEIVVQLPWTEPHPPLYYALLDVWTSLAGTSPVALRFPSAVLGTVAVGLVYALGERLGDRWVGASAAAFMAVGSLPVSQSQEARMYALLAFATVLSFWTFVRVLEAPSRKRGAAYVGSALLVGYAHAFGLLAVAAQAAYVVWRGSPRAWRARFGLVAAGLAPWLLAAGTGFLTGTGSAQRLAWIPEASTRLLARAPAGFLGIDRWVSPGTAAWLAIPLGGVAAYGALPGGRSDEPGTATVEPGVLLGLWLAIGLLVPFLVSKLAFPVYRPRYTIVAAPAFLILLALGLAAVPDRRAGLLLAVALLAASVFPLHGYYTEDGNEQWDEAASFVAGHAEERDVVLVGDHRPGWIETRTAFTYYFDASVPVHGITSETPAAELARLSDERGRVWLVLSHIDEPDAERIQAALEDAAGEGQPAWEGIGIEVHRFGADGDAETRFGGAYRLSTGPLLPS